MKLLLPLVISSWLCLATVEAARILMLAPVCSKSHRHGFMPIMEALAKRGHQVTVITPYSSKQAIPNLTEITIQSAFDATDVDWFGLTLMSPFQAIVKILGQFTTLNEKGYQRLMENKDFQKLLATRDVDLVIVDAILNDFTMPIVDAMNVPFMFFCPAAAVPWLADYMNMPQEYSYVPAGQGDYGTDMTFFQRLGNMLSSEIFLAIRKWFVLPPIDEMVQKDFPGARPIAQIERDAQIAIINSHPATAWVRPLPPNIIAVPAMHVRPPHRLPEELKKLADEAEKGFIVFTLGSVIPVSSMSPETLDVFVKVFARLPQRIFWKWEQPEEMKDKISPNVVLLDWLPQQDLIGHENAKLFISHGGLMGIQEAVYHGVPLLGLPFGNDQRGNMAKARQEGYALKLDWTELNEENLFNSIQRILSEPSFQGNASRLSSLMQDSPLPADDIACYWIEYVLRHGGAQHLQLGSKDMPKYQVYLVDIWVFLGVLGFLVVYLDIMIVRWLLRKCRPKKVKTQ